MCVVGTYTHTHTHTSNTHKSNQNKSWGQRTTCKNFGKCCPTFSRKKTRDKNPLGEKLLWKSVADQASDPTHQSVLRMRIYTPTVYGIIHENTSDIVEVSGRMDNRSSLAPIPTQRACIEARASQELTTEYSYTTRRGQYPRIIGVIII